MPAIVPDYHNLSQPDSPVIQCGHQAADWFASYLDSGLSEAELTELIERERKAESDLYFESGDLPIAPEDCKRYDQHVQSICAIVDNMYLIWSEEGRSNWAERNRRDLMKSYIQQFEEEQENLAYEEKRLH